MRALWVSVVRRQNLIILYEQTSESFLPCNELHHQTSIIKEGSHYWISNRGCSWIVVMKWKMKKEIWESEIQLLSQRECPRLSSDYIRWKIVLPPPNCSHIEFFFYELTLEGIALVLFLVYVKNNHFAYFALKFYIITVSSNLMLIIWIQTLLKKWNCPLLFLSTWEILLCC